MKFFYGKQSQIFYFAELKEINLGETYWQNRDMGLRDMNYYI